MKQNQEFLPIIGMEVHVELKTKSKMFCGCLAKHFRVKPNTHTCPVCLGLPGALPVPNKKAIEWTLLLGLALNCKVNKFSKFDRKNYFYPDLPKGYQISQYDRPFACNGELKLKTQNSKLKVIRLNRVHLEEDTAKLIHTKGWTLDRVGPSIGLDPGEGVTLIDFNRSGVPLVEIVSEPDISSSEETGLYLKKLQQIIRYLGISDADMEKGSMRCEANVSLASQYQISNIKNQKYISKIKNEKTFNLTQYKVEIKNINSFRFVKRAIDYEIERQTRLLRQGKTPIQETRGFDEKTGKTYPQRFKEEAHDYRYFPEPDIPPVTKLKAQSSKFKAKLPELPDKKHKRFVRQYKLSEYNANILTLDKTTADYFEEMVKVGRKHKIPAQKIGNLIVNKKVNIKKYSPGQLLKMLLQTQLQKIGDKRTLSRVITKVLRTNPKAVADFKKGKQEALDYLLGQVMRETKGKADPLLTHRLLLEKLT